MTTTTTTGNHARNRPSVSAANDDGDDGVRAAQRLARITGALYLAIAILGMFAGTVSTGLVVAGDAAATTDKVMASAALVRGSLVAWIVDLVADLAVAVTLFVLLKPVSATLSRLAAVLRVAYVAVQGINLLNLFNALVHVTGPNSLAGSGAEQANALALSSLVDFGTGFKVGLIVFGAHLIVLGYLLATSRYVPRLVGILVVAAGIGYVGDNLGSFFVPGYGGPVRAVLMVPALVGELVLTCWLLVKGVNVRPGGVARTSVNLRPTSADARTTLSVGAAGGAR